MIRPGMQPQNPMLFSQPAQPQIPMGPNTGPNPPMGMLAQNPNAQRFSMPMGHPPQRQMMIRTGPGPEGQPMNPMAHNQLQGMNFNMPQGGNPMGRRPVSQGQMGPAQLQGPPSGPVGMDPRTGMPGLIRAAQNQTQRMGVPIPGEMGMGRGNPIPDNMRQGSLPLMNSLGQPPSMGQQQQMPGGMGAPQNNFASIQQQQLSSSPRLGLHPQGPPNMGIPAPGPRDEFYQQFPPGPSNPPRSGFPFASSSTPPMGDMGGQGRPNMANNAAGNNRLTFQPTPAEQYKNMQGSGNDYPPPSFGGPNANVPPRPPSRHNPPSAIPSQPQQPPHPSPHSSPMYPPRPSSRPPSQSGPPPHPSQTPRPNQQQPVPSNAPQSARVPSTSQPPQPPGGSQPLAIAPRPPVQPAPGSSPGSSTAQSSEQQQQQQPVTGAISIPRAPPHVVTLALGNGQALTRLLQFSGNLSNESNTKYQLSWWNDLIKEYFTPKAVMRLTLWKDNQRHEAKPFEIGVPILPRFFLVTTQSGVKSMTLSLDGARERMYAHGHAIVECVTAVWTYRYKNGYIVTLRGPLTAHVIITSPHPPGSASMQPGNFILKFDEFQFDANFHDKYIALDSIVGQRTPAPDNGLSPKTPRMRNTPTSALGMNGNGTSEDEKLWEEPRLMIERGSIPGEPVNAFGIPQATMRCLELAESVAQMTDLITFAGESNMGPLEALSRYAAKIRDSQGLGPSGPPPMLNGIPNGHPSLPFAPPFSAQSTLYSSAPPSITNPSSAPTTSTMSSPQNAPPSAQNSPQKQHKTIPPSLASSSTASAPTASTPASTHNTPALTNATLKRKQGSDASPTTDNPQPAKRMTTRGKRRGGAAGG